MKRSGKWLANREWGFPLVLSRLTGISTLALAALLLGACSNSTSPTSGPTSGGTVVMAWDEEGQSLAPYQQVYSSEENVNINLYNTLVTYDPQQQKYLPDLAINWTPSSDGLTWTIKLRSGVKFTDGTPFNAQAAKFTLDWINNPKSKASPFTTGFLAGYSSSEASDDSTLIVHFSQVNGRFLDGISSAQLSMVSPTAVQQYGDSFGRHPVGTGPFMFKEWVSGSHMTLVRNPNYWGPKPYIDTLTFQFVSNDNSRSAALQRGDIQYAFLPFAFNPQYQANKQFTTKVVPRPGTVRAIQFNMQQQFVQDPNVRRAIAYGIDRSSIAKAPFLGQAAIEATTPLSPTTADYDGSLAKLAYGYDPNKAKSTLDSAGWTVGSDGIRTKNGQRLSLVLRTVQLTFLDSVALLVQSQLKAIGIEVKLDLSPDWGSLLPNVQSGAYDMMLGGSFVSDPGILDVNYDPRQIGKSFLIFTRDPDPQLADLIVTADSKVSADDRFKAYSAVQRNLMENIALVPMYVEPFVFAMTPRLHGVTYNRDSEPIFGQAYLSS